MTTKRELGERFIKTITKYHLHLADVYKKYISDLGTISIYLTFTGKELGFKPEECRELAKYGIIKSYANMAGLDQIEVNIETRKLMCQKLNSKFRRLGLKELRCKI